MYLINHNSKDNKTTEAVNITAERPFEGVDSDQEKEIIPTLSVQEILLLNKSTGIPIFSRAYKETSGKDPALVAGLMAAIVQFGEMIGNNMELNDIGIHEGSRIFIRGYKDLVCLLTIDNFPVTLTTSRKFVEIINELSSRIFEAIRMMMAIPVNDSNGSIDEVIYETTDSSLEGHNLSVFPGLGPIIDNIVLETTALFYEDENLEAMAEAMVEKGLFAMEESDSTYLTSEYSGTTREIKKEKITKLRNLFSIFSLFGNMKG